MIRLRLKHDLPKDFAKQWGFFITPEKRKGWETWVDEKYLDAVGCKHSHLHPESNKYSINFPATFFEVLDQKSKLENVLTL